MDTTENKGIFMSMNHKKGLLSHSFHPRFCIYEDEHEPFLKILFYHNLSKKGDFQNNVQELKPLPEAL
jgi:hypothetical protein